MSERNTFINDNDDDDDDMVYLQAENASIRLNKYGVGSNLSQNGSLLSDDKTEFGQV